jgi:hypothetical protein
MTDTDALKGLPNGPCEHWFSKVQIMGGPATAWVMRFDPDTVRRFLETTMADVKFGQVFTSDNERLIDFDFVLPSGFIEHEGVGQIRLDPAPGIYLDRISYGMTYDLLEAILQHHPDNDQIVVAFDGYRAMCYVPHLPRPDGIVRLTEDLDLPLSAALFPQEWRE